MPAQFSEGSSKKDMASGTAAFSGAISSRRKPRTAPRACRANQSLELIQALMA